MMSMTKLFRIPPDGRPFEPAILGTIICCQSLHLSRTQNSLFKVTEFSYFTSVQDYTTSKESGKQSALVQTVSPSCSFTRIKMTKTYV